MAQNNPLSLLGFGKKTPAPAPTQEAPVSPASPGEQEGPLITVLSGNPTEEELAALTAVAMASQAEAEAKQESTWAMWQRRLNNTQQLGLRLRPGPGSWKRARPQ